MKPYNVSGTFHTPSFLCGIFYSIQVPCNPWPLSGRGIYKAGAVTIVQCNLY